MASALEIKKAFKDFIFNGMGGDMYGTITEEEDNCLTFEYKRPMDKYFCHIYY